MSDPIVDQELPIKFTDAAAKKVLSLITEEENPELKLRVYVTGGGCSGFQYEFTFDKKLGSFCLKSIHPGHTIEEVDEMTGFTYEKPINIPQTPKPNMATIELIRGLVADEVSETYPAFAERVFAN